MVRVNSVLGRKGERGSSALSRKRPTNLAESITQEKELIKEMRQMDLGINISPTIVQERITGTKKIITLAVITVQADLRRRIHQCSQVDTQHMKYREMSQVNSNSRFKEGENGLLYFDKRVCVPDNLELKKEILSEAHESGYSIHPGEVKMYKDLRMQFWWSNMKKDVSNYVARCIICQQVKAERKKIAGLLYPNSRAQEKFQIITMDFITGLPRTRKRYDSIWVIVDTLTKIAHFIPLTTETSGRELAELFVQYQLKYHGCPETIISDRDSRFTYIFGKVFKKPWEPN